MKFTPLAIPGAFEITLERIADQRGFFARMYCGEEFGNHGLNTVWPQMNVSKNLEAGTLRGLHFQRAPATEVKLVRCLSGCAFDVMVDLRQDSPSFGQHVTIRLEAELLNAVYVPQGFAHGFQAMLPNTIVQYMTSCAWSPEHEGGINPLDPALAIEWPMAAGTMSERDRTLPPLHEVEPL